MRPQRRNVGLLAAALAGVLLIAGCGDSDSANDLPFDFYVLSLSWSPSYCAEAGADAEQCDRDRAQGFVVHGLWPQFENGYPEFCEAPALRRAALDKARSVMPSTSLARHQWRKHGSCTGLAAEAYFDAVRAARNAVRIPEELRRAAAARRLSSTAIEQAFIEANPGLSRDAIAVSCADRTLHEVRICLTPDLSFRSCPEVDRRGCRAGQLAVPAR